MIHHYPFVVALAFALAEGVEAADLRVIRVSDGDTFTEPKRRTVRPRSALIRHWSPPCGHPGLADLDQVVGPPVG